MNRNDRPVHVVGGGLAGSEAAWQLARAGVPVVLHEMRPLAATAAHATDQLAELVCSNSFRSDDAMNNAVGRRADLAGDVQPTAIRRRLDRLRIAAERLDHGRRIAEFEHDGRLLPVHDRIAPRQCDPIMRYFNKFGQDSRLGLIQSEAILV